MKKEIYVCDCCEEECDILDYNGKDLCVNCNNLAIAEFGNGFNTAITQNDLIKSTIYGTSLLKNLNEENALKIIGTSGYEILKDFQKALEGK